METELTFGVLLGEGRERQERKGAHSTASYGRERERCRELERKRGRKPWKEMSERERKRKEEEVREFLLLK